MLNVRATMQCTQIILNLIESTSQLRTTLTQFQVDQLVLNQGTYLLQALRRACQQHTLAKDSYHNALYEFNQAFGVQYPRYLTHLQHARRHVTEVGAKYQLGLSAPQATTQSAQIEHMERFYQAVLDDPMTQQVLQRCDIKIEYIQASLQRVQQLIECSLQLRGQRAQLQAASQQKHTEHTRLDAWNTTLVAQAQQARMLNPGLAHILEPLITAPQLAQVEALSIACQYAVDHHVAA